MSVNRVSAFTLERYKLGELEPGDYETLTRALETDGELRSRLDKIEASDRELRLKYPAALLGLETSPAPGDTFPFAGKAGTKRRFGGTPARRALYLRAVAAVFICAMLPVFYLLLKSPAVFRGVPVQTAKAFPPERVKGLGPQGAGLTLYLKGSGELPLSGRETLREGSTVQLAYTAPAGPDSYGVIFSLDGRKAVTMHYPGREGQSSLLRKGSRIFLDEAYTLDDAPDYEIFVMVVSETPLDTGTVFREARRIAEAPENTPEVSGSSRLSLLEEKSRAAFADCEVEIISVLKE